jgi:hypothetical protein
MICPCRFTALAAATASAAVTTDATANTATSITATTTIVFASTADAFWFLVVATLLPLFPPPLPAPPLPLLSANAIATVAAPQTTAPIPFAVLAAAGGTFFAAVTTSSLILLPTANVSAAQTLPLFPPPLHHCLCFQSLCRHYFCHDSHHCQKLPTCWLVGASKGSSRHHGQVSWEREVYFRQYSLF